MPSAVINVRPVPGNTLPHLIRVTRRNTEAVVAALDRQVILYAPRDHELHGYFASAMLVDMSRFERPNVHVRRNPEY